VIYPSKTKPARDATTRGGHHAGRDTVAACIITRDEVHRLPECLSSVLFCDEIVVVDSGSVDGTVELARRFGAEVIETTWRGYAVARNAAIDAAQAAWVLEIDADERISDALREEILAFVASPPDGVEIAGMPWRNSFLGRRLGPSASYPSYRLRLFRRGSYRHDEARAVHEGLWAHGRTWYFAGDLEHVLATTWREAVGDMWRYARLEARHATVPRRAGALLRGIAVRPLAKFMYRAVVLEGWRDGWQGVVKIALDCMSDALVWVRRVMGSASADGAPRAETQHFGQRTGYAGPARLIGVALTDRHVGGVAEWLRQARADGAETVLVTAARGTVPPDLIVRRLPSASPFALIRALEAETQFNPIDALVTVGWPERLLARGLPRHLRGTSAPSLRPGSRRRHRSRG